MNQFLNKKKKQIYEIDGKMNLIENKNENIIKGLKGIIGKTKKKYVSSIKDYPICKILRNLYYTQYVAIIKKNSNIYLFTDKFFYKYIKMKNLYS